MRSYESINKLIKTPYYSPGGFGQKTQRNNFGKPGNHWKERVKGSTLAQITAPYHIAVSTVYTCFGVVTGSIKSSVTIVILFIAVAFGNRDEKLHRLFLRAPSSCPTKVVQWGPVIWVVTEICCSLIMMR